MVTTTIVVYSNHEVVLPVAWSRNTVMRVISLSKKPQQAKIRYQIVDRGVYRFGWRVSEFDPVLGFTININGIDKVVLYPVNPTDWIEIDVTDVITNGDNAFYGVIWRSLINLVVSFYVVFNITLICEDEEEITYESRPIQSVTPQQLFDITNIINLIYGVINIVIVLYFLPLFGKIVEMFANIIETKEKEHKEK